MILILPTLICYKDFNPHTKCLIDKVCTPTSKLYGTICRQFLGYANIICKIWIGTRERRQGTH